MQTLTRAQARALKVARRVIPPDRPGAALKVKPVVLEGRHVRLEPMRTSHFEGLLAAALYPQLWQLGAGTITRPSDMRRYMKAALDGRRAGNAMPWVTLDRASGRVIGSTRFGNIAARERRVEIGWTWITPEFQRTPVNTEAKFLMLRHAFETLGCLRVELKTDVLNLCSRAAMLRIGAKQEGVMRQQMLAEDGRVRDSIYFSILDLDWPKVKRGLQAKLRRKWVRG